ncbi:lipid-binding SYLF domain-containing protein [Aeoliella mucimassa]|uniref:lipid-binding SYLF domain-containing protein n=1 Tax=Aeoliella mucimassa TaxID=2527972 RepID=UPI001E5B5F5E|nr:lipid-binding SYLF domain-containing protein [Aeoliella mucimassa]
MIALLLVAAGIESSAYAQAREDEAVRASIQVLNEVMAIPAQAIPQRMLEGAEGIAIIPNVIKGGFVIGARHGRGTLIVRDDNGGWHAPVFVTLTGGSVGWQAGVQSTDVILVFKTKKSINGIFTNKFTLGVDAAAAAGPVGRQAAAATDAQLQAEIYSYARSRGLFLGASLDGSMLKVDGMANAAYYQNLDPQQPVAIPPAAVELVRQVDAYSTSRVTPVEPGAVANNAVPVPNNPGTTQPMVQQPMPTQQAPLQAVPGQPQLLAQRYATPDSDVIRGQLSSTSPKLFDQLTPEWRTYLALPAEVFTNQSHPPVEAIQQSLRNYEQVIANPSYQALSSLPAFQSTYGLLKHYESTLVRKESVLNLPPPPTSTNLAPVISP